MQLLSKIHKRAQPKHNKIDEMRHTYIHIFNTSLLAVT